MEGRWTGDIPQSSEIFHFSISVTWFFQTNLIWDLSDTFLETDEVFRVCWKINCSSVLYTGIMELLSTTLIEFK